MRQMFFDIKVISPYARNYVDYKPEALFKKAEQDKMREYRARILEVEHADFTPLVFTCAEVLPHKAKWCSKDWPKGSARNRALTTLKWQAG